MITVRKEALLVVGMVGFVLAATSSRAGETISYTYDALGRLIRTQSTGTVNNNQVRTVCYDKAGNRLEYTSKTTASPGAACTV